MYNPTALSHDLFDVQTLIDRFDRKHCRKPSDCPFFKALNSQSVPLVMGRFFSDQHGSYCLFSPPASLYDADDRGSRGPALLFNLKVVW